MTGDLWLDLRGPDAVFLVTTTTFITMLEKLEKYKAAPSHLGLDRLLHQLGQYSGYYEAGKHGDRINIALRKGARETLTSTCRGGLHFLQAVVTEEDVPLLLQGGVQRRQQAHRKNATKGQSSTE